jgi:hypothetical protein
MIRKYAAGDNIASHCTRCKLLLDHAIVAMEGDVIAKVKCKTCGSSHKFRSPEDVKRPRSVGKKVEPQKSAETVWELCLAEAKGRERVYDRAEKYRIGDIVDHQVFGRGVVRKLYINKCDILFKDKERLMASSN